MAKPEWMPPRVYQWVTLRALGFHLLFLVIAAGCAVAADWQIHRAMEGNTLSYLYSFEWPAIAIVVGIGWWQLVHDTPEDIAGRSEYHRRMRAASAEVVARTLPRSARALTVGSEEVTGRAIEASKRSALASGAAAPAGSASLVPAGRPPAVRGAGQIEAPLLEPEPDAPADELDEYNRYLAALAVKGRPKTWRNPRGL